MLIYSTDVTDSEWELITSMQCDTRQRRYSLRQIWNAIFYLVKTGCQWRYLPSEFPAWQSVYYYYSRWRDNGLIDEVHQALYDMTRQRAGREASASLAIIDAQSVKTAYRGSDRGFDAGKRVKGRKRHIVVDTLGLLIGVIVTSAAVSDSAGARQLLRQMRHRFPRLRCIMADASYQGTLVDCVKRTLDCLLQIVRRDPSVKGFAVLPKRWIVERTFSWFNNYRRLSKDYEYRIDTSETMIQLAMIRLMLKRFS
jgi:putative transposase